MSEFLHWNLDVGVLTLMLKSWFGSTCTNFEIFWFWSTYIYVEILISWSGTLIASHVTTCPCCCTVSKCDIWQLCLSHIYLLSAVVTAQYTKLESWAPSAAEDCRYFQLSTNINTSTRSLEGSNLNVYLWPSETYYSRVYLYQMWKGTHSPKMCTMLVQGFISVVCCMHLPLAIRHF